jgi:type VI secretion system protein VasJ
MSLEKIINLASQKIEDSKVGENCRNDERFLEIKLQLSANTDPSSLIVTTNWPKINKLASEILSEESKDLLVTSYLAIGLFKTDGIIGLASGIDLLIQNIDNYWENLYPPLRRLNGRWAAFNWLVDQLSAYLENTTDTKPASEVDALIKSLSALDKKLSSINDDAPNFLAIIKQFERIIAPEEIHSEDESEAESIGPSALFQGVSSSSLTDVDSAKEQLNCLWRVAGEIGEYLKDNGNDLFLAFRLTRISLWQPILSLPDCDENHKTQVPSPESDQISQLDLLKMADNKEGILEVCEPWVTENPFWLDLNFIIYKSMCEMPAYLHIAESIQIELLSFYTRFPLLNKLCFSDGTPMMGEATAKWLDQSKSLVDDITLIDKTQDNGANYSELELKFIDELIMVEKKSLKMKISDFAKLQYYLQSNISEKLKIKLLIAIISSLLGSKNKTMLSAYAGVLEHKLNYFHLEEWDSSLASIVLLKLVQAKTSLDEEVISLQKRLALADITAALNLSK